MAWSLGKIALVAGGGILGGAACLLTAGAAAPAVGALLGSAMGLSGAAATSAGLAALGGGALAAGGGGMAAGAALVTTALTGAGAVLGTLGMGTIANFFNDSNKAFEEAINDQKDYAKAQEIIKQQEAKIRELEQKLEEERRKANANQENIDKLRDLIEVLKKDKEEKETRLKALV